MSASLFLVAQHRKDTLLPDHCMQNNRPRSSDFEARLRKCCVTWQQWAIAAETATSATFGGVCNYVATSPRPPPHHASVDSATLAARSLAHNLRNTGFDLPSDARPSARIDRRHDCGIRLIASIVPLQAVS